MHHFTRRRDGGGQRNDLTLGPACSRPPAPHAVRDGGRYPPDPVHARQQAPFPARHMVGADTTTDLRVPGDPGVPTHHCHLPPPAARRTPRGTEGTPHVHGGRAPQGTNGWLSRYGLTRA